MEKKPHIAIIILNWNGLKDTKACLKSLFQLRYPHFSITVVDNASEKDELTALKTFCKDQKPQAFPGTLHFIQNSDNLGFAGGNNVGIKQALNHGTDLIFTLNNDTEVEANILDQAVKAWELYPEHRIGIIATKMINQRHRHRLDNVGHDLLSTGDTVPRGRDQNPEQHQLTRFTMGACAGAAFYSAKMLKQIGLFDEDFFLNYEDSDLSLRAIVRGWDCLLAPKAIVYHQINASIRKIKDSRYRVRSQRNQLWAYLHNIPLPVICLNFPWIMLRDLLVLIISIISLRWTITSIFLRSRWAVIRSLPLVLKKRHHVLRHQQLSSWTIWRQQRSWFSIYWEYFRMIILKGKRSVMD